MSSSSESQNTSTGFEIFVETVNKTKIILPIGDICMAYSSKLRKILNEVAESEPEKIVLDLSKVSYMDSSGLAILIETVKNCRTLNIAFLLCEITTRVRSIIEIARLDSVFKICSTRKDALDN